MEIKNIVRQTEAELVEAGAALASTSSASAQLPVYFLNSHKRTSAYQQVCFNHLRGDLIISLFTA